MTKPHTFWHQRCFPPANGFSDCKIWDFEYLGMFSLIFTTPKNLSPYCSCIFWKTLKSWTRAFGDHVHSGRMSRERHISLPGWAQHHQTPSKDPRFSPLPSYLFPLPTFTPNLLRWHSAYLLLIKFSLTKILIWILMTINLIAISQFLEAFCPTMLTADHFQVQTYCMKRKIIVHWVMFSFFWENVQHVPNHCIPGTSAKISINFLWWSWYS